MRLEEFQALAGTTLSNIQLVEKDLFRAEAFLDKTRMSVEFFDFSKAVLREGFDLNEYQEKIFADDFYGNPGSIQWNYYLWLVCEKEEIQKLIEGGTFLDIESNLDFARKKIVEPDELKLKLRKKEFHRTKSKAIGEDLGQVWIGALRTAKLDAVFMPEVNYQEGVETFIAGEPILDINNLRDNEVSLDDLVKVERIDGIKLGDDYRKHPNQIRDFKFGRLTLFSGPNGTGKTSVLDAIELWTCGQTSQDRRGQFDKPSSIRVKLEGKKEFESPPTANSIFRKRDLVWYGTHYKTGNNIADRFNRFNYFNAEAAAMLETEKNPTAIYSAFKGLILGDRANEIQGRIDAFKKLFSSRLREFSKESSDLQKHLDQLTSAYIDLGGAKDSEEKVLKDLGNDFRTFSLKIVGRPGFSLDKKTLISIEKEIGGLLIEMRQLLSTGSIDATLSAESIRSQQEKIQKVVVDVSAAMEARDVFEANREDRAVEIEELKALSVLFTRLAPYRANKEADGLVGLDERMAKLSGLVQQIEISESLILKINFDELKTNNLSLDKAIEKISGELKGLQASLRDIEIKRERSTTTTNRIQELSAEIRAIGNEILEIDPAIEVCPFCKTVHKKGELKSALNKQIPGAKLEKGEVFAEQGKILEKKIQGLKKQLVDLRKIDELRTELNGFGLSISGKVEEILKRLRGLPKVGEESQRTLLELKSFLVKMKKGGLTEEGYNEIVAELEEAGKGELVAGSITEFRKANVETIAALKKAENDLTEDSTEVEKRCTSALKGALVYLPGKEINEKYLGQLKRIRKDIEGAVALVEKARKIFGLTSKSDLKFIVVNSEKVRDRIRRANERLDSLLLSAEKKKQFEKDIAESKRGLGVSLKKKTASKKALDVLESLESGEDYVNEFWQSNRSAIVDIYRELHSPNEFVDIEIDSSHEEIILVGKDGDRRSIQRISSGQRSALALSVFIALNAGLVHGPKYIIFDDPVVHVDDLNVLVFMDYLRKLVLEDGRQIVFATASSKMAGLLTRKFDFLGSDFVQYTLERPRLA